MKKVVKYTEFAKNPEKINEGYMGLKDWTDSDNTADFMFDCGKDLARALNSKFSSHVNAQDNGYNTDGAEDVGMAAEYWMPILDKVGGSTLTDMMKPSMKKVAAKLQAKLDAREKDKAKGKDVADGKHVAAWKRMKAFAEKWAK